MKIGALMLARSGSSFMNKNIHLINGYPLMAYGMMAAKQTNKIDYFFLSSDSEEYLEIGKNFGYEPIKRPENISNERSKSDDAVSHAYTLNADLMSCEIIVVQHANVATIYPDIILESIDILQSDKKLTSVVPAHINNEYNPYRSFFIKESKNIINPSMKYNSSISPNRQDLPDAYFLDHSFWCIRSKNILKKFNFCPWNSLGDKIYPLKTENMFDVHDKKDIKKSEEWINQNRERLNYLKWN